MNKKRQKIGTRLALVVAIAVLLTALATFAATFFMLDNVINEADDARAADNLETIKKQIETLEEKSQMAANSIAYDSTVIATSVFASPESAFLA